MTATNPETSKRPLVERHYEKPKKTLVPHTTHLKEFLMPDGRRLLLDRRSIAFLCQGKPEEFGDRATTIIGFKTMAKPCPVATSYDELVTWWRAETPAGNGKAA